MALVAMIILGVLIFLLTGSGGFMTEYAQLRTFMQDSSGVAENQPVRLNGILVGNVEAVRLSGDSNPERIVEIVMSVEERFLSEIPVDSAAGISAANLLGDKFINITKGQSPQSVQPNAEIRSLRGQDIPELMAQSADLLRSFQVIMQRFDGLLADIESGKGNIGKFLRDEEFYTRLNAVASEAERLMTGIRSGTGTLSRLINDDSLYRQLHSTTERLDSLLASLQRGQGTAGKLLNDPALYQETQKSIAELRGLIAGLNSGRGTAGKLLNDETLYKELSNLTASIDSTIDKLNSGQGTLGQFVVNPQLYESTSAVTRELQALVKDIRANPRKFLSIKLSLF
jgi:phospholipid/cholesterol/gamma-HCH transport system substrate-binding protein